MYLSKYVLVAWIMVNAVYFLMGVRAKRKHKKKDYRMRNLERTIEKLKRANGKLWYDVRKKEKTAAFEMSELTQTNV